MTFAEVQVEGGRATDILSAARNKQLVLLAIEGVPANRAAAIVGCSADTARAVYRSPTFQRVVQEKMDEALDNGENSFKSRAATLQDALAQQAWRSFDELVDMLKGDNLSAGLRVKIHQDFLDRSPESSRKGNVGVQFSWNPDQLKLAAQTASEMDEVINITPIVPEEPPSGQMELPF